MPQTEPRTASYGQCQEKARIVSLKALEAAESMIDGLNLPATAGNSAPWNSEKMSALASIVDSCAGIGVDEDEDD